VGSALRTRLVAGGLAAVVVTLGGCTTGSTEASESGETVTVQHAQGKTQVPVEPEKVVTFDMGTLDTMTELGVDVAGVPKETLPEYLSQYESDDYADAGTLFEPDLEAVNAADPDLIIVAGRSSDAYDSLSDIAPTVDLTLDSSEFLSSFKEQTRTLGRIFDKSDKVDNELRDLDKAISETRADAADAGTALTVLTTGGKVSAYGPGSRFGMIHDVLGMQPADENIDADTHGEAVSFEYIGKKDPDWLFVIDRDAAIDEEDGAAAREVLDNELVHNTTAWQQDQVVYLNPTRWYIVNGGLNTVTKMVSEVGSALD